MMAATLSGGCFRPDLAGTRCSAEGECPDGLTCGTDGICRGEDPTDPSFELKLLDPAASVPLDGMNQIGIQITRRGGFAAPVMLAGKETPNGLTIEPVAIEEDQTTATVIVSGAAPLEIGDIVTFSIEGTAEGVEPETVTLTNALVTDRPGALDVSFGPNGLAAVSFGGDDGGVFTSMQVIEGSVVATGIGFGGLGAIGFRTMRFTADGNLDPTWNGGELVRTNLGSSSNDRSEPYAIGQQRDGRLIAIGLHKDPKTPSDIGLVRYSVSGGSGGLDFGQFGDGTSVVDIGGDEQTNDGIVLESSAIIAVGELIPTGEASGHLVISRFTPNGLLDTTFAAPAGFDVLARGSSSRADATTTDDQGRILIAGTFATEDQNDVLLLRYNDDGSHDASFGSAGEVVVSGPANERAVAVRADGDAIYLATMANEESDAFFRTRRYSESGDLDSAFGDQGIAELLVTDVDARDMVVLADGRVVMLGTSAGQAFFVRFKREGQVDTFFGPDGTGTVTVYIGDGGDPRALEAYSTHQIVFCGGNEGGVPGPGTFGIVGRMWM
jgi:uncharacterized delta-60 repeat protein